jgi:MarR family transcriptional regulator, lower aerobic nicotinate degradation pathway regulator
MNATSPQTTEVRKTPRLPAELVASATFLLKRLGFAAKERSHASYEEIGLHPYHHAILLVVDEGSSETQGAIADALGYDRGQLVERRRDPDDRRRHIVRLTPEGKQALRKVRALARRIEDDFLAPLNDEERAQLHALLLRLAETHEPRCALQSPSN